MCYTTVNNPDVSPVISLRGNKETQIDLETGNTSFIPRACMSRGYIPESLVKRKRSSSLKKQRQAATQGSMREERDKCKSKFLSIKDVNSIDRFSRLLFPLLFLIVNVVYWGFYLVL